MAWTTPITFVTGNTLTAAQMNTYLRDNTNFLHDPPGCLATRTTAQVISNNTATQVSYNATDIYDSDSMHDPVGAPTDIIINTAGVYVVTVAVTFAANATGARWMVVGQLGGAGIEFAGAKDSGPTAGIDSSLATTFTYKFAAGPNQLQVTVQQTSGGNLSITNANTNTLSGFPPVCQFGAQWVSDG